MKAHSKLAAGWACAALWIVLLGVPAASAPAVHGRLQQGAAGSSLAEKQAAGKQAAGSQEGVRGGETPANKPGPALAERLATARQKAADFRAKAEAAPALREALAAQEKAEQQRLVEQAGKTSEVIIPSGQDLVTLQAGLAAAEAKRDAAEKALTDLEATASEREARLAELPAEIVAAEEAVQAAEERIATAGPETSSERFEEWRAELELARAKLDARVAEQEALEALSGVLPLQRDAALRKRKSAQQSVAAWNAATVAATQRDAESATREAEGVLDDILERHPSLRRIAAENRDMALARSAADGSPAKLAAAAKSVETARELLDETLRRESLSRRRLATGELTQGMATKLRRDFEWLPSRAELKVTRARLERELTQAEIRDINLREREVGDAEEELAALLLELDGVQPEDDWTEAALELLGQQRDLRRSALEEVESLQKRLYEARALHAEATEAVESYRAFLEARIVWVRSSSIGPVEMVTTVPRAVLELAAETTQAVYVLSTRGDGGALSPPGNVILALLTVLLAVVLRAFMLRKLREVGELTRSYRTDGYILTVRALLQSVILALPGPLLLWALGRWLEIPAMDPLFRDAGGAMREVAVLYGTLRLVKVVLKPGGVGLAHFRWKLDSVDHVRKHLRWFEPVSVLLSFVAVALDHHRIESWSDSVGRVAFVVWMIAMAFFLEAALGNKSPVWEARSGDDSTGFFRRTRRFWLALAATFPVVLAGLALLGYYYTALQFELRMRSSAYFLLALLGVYSLLLRWLFISRRRLAVAQAIEARERKRKKKSVEAGDEGPAVDVDHVNIPSVDAQTRQLFKSSMTLASVLGLYLIWTSALPALQMLDRIQILPRIAVVEETEQSGAFIPASRQADGDDGAQEDGASAEGTPAGGSFKTPGLPLPSQPEGDGPSAGLPATLTLGDVLLALIFIALTSVAVRNLPALLELALLQRLPLDGGARYAITTILRYVILIIGVTAISGAIGVGWAQVQWLAAALTFGLAFGLQEIFANFVSGLIILIERPVRVGDIVTVGGTEGRVTQLRMRATTILDWDRREFLIPNKEFITSSVINWTLSDPITRMIIPVGVAYGSDTDRARQLLMEAAEENRWVLEDPKPTAIFRRFGESTLDFDLRVFISNRDLWPVVIDDLHSGIDRKFRAAGVEIAFPQRDVHVRGSVRLESPVAGGGPEAGEA